MNANGHQPSANFMAIELRGWPNASKSNEGDSVERRNTGNMAAPAAASTPAISPHEARNARPSRVPRRERTSMTLPPTASAMPHQAGGRRSRLPRKSGRTKYVSQLTTANNSATAGQSLRSSDKQRSRTTPAVRQARNVAPCADSNATDNRPTLSE